MTSNHELAIGTVGDRFVPAPRNANKALVFTGTFRVPFWVPRVLMTSNVEEFLAEIDWGAVSKRLVAYALRRLRRFAPSLATETHAMDVVHQAIVHLIDDEHRDWVPEGDHPTLQGLLFHLGSEINGIVINQQRKVIRRPSSRSLSDLASKAQPVEDATVDHRLMEADMMRRATQLLEGHDAAQQILHLFAEGCTKAADQAKVLGWPVKKVYKIREQVRSRLEELRDGRN